MTPKFIKESDSLAKMAKDTAIHYTNTSNNCLVSRRHLYHISSSKIHARMKKFHQKYFIELIPYEDVNPEKIRQSKYKLRNIHKIENKLTLSNFTQKRNFHVNNANHFIKHNIQKFWSHKNKVLT